MPIYDYDCTSCGRRIEVLHGIDAAGPTTCEVCGGTLRKALSPPAIVFKGSGWAKVDARASASKAGSASSKAEGSGESTTGASTDASAAPGASSTDGGASSTSSGAGSATGAASKTASDAG